MDMAAAAVAVFGLFTGIGGLLGYLRARSGISLVSGLISAALLFWCARGIAQASLGAAIASIVITLLLGGRFAGAWQHSRRLMPDLLMVILSTVTLLVIAADLVPYLESPGALPRLAP